MAQGQTGRGVRGTERGAGARPKKGAPRARTADRPGKATLGAGRTARRSKPSPKPRAFEGPPFGAVPAGATHVVLRRQSPSGFTDKLYVQQGGLEIDRLPLKMATIDAIRSMWGAGVYRGQWMHVDASGKWKGLGSTREVRIVQQAPSPARQLPSRGSQSSAAWPGATPSTQSTTGAQAASLQTVAESTEVVDMRVRAVQEIARERLAVHKEIADERLAFYQSQHQEQLSRVEERLAELEARALEQSTRAPAKGPFDWLEALVKHLAPSIEKTLPDIMARLVNQPQVAPVAPIVRRVGG